MLRRVLLLLCALFVSALALPSDSFYALGQYTNSDLAALYVSPSGAAAQNINLNVSSFYCNQVSSAPGGELYVAVQGEDSSVIPATVARVSSSGVYWYNIAGRGNSTFGNILYDLVSPTAGWVYTVVRNGNWQTNYMTYNIVGLNPATAVTYIVKQYVAQNPPQWTCLDDGGLTIDPNGWLSYFISTYDNEEVGTLIWNYNVMSNVQTFVTLNTSQTWYTQGFQYSPVLGAHVAIGGRDAINYGYLAIVTYSVGKLAIEPHCLINTASLPVYACIGQSFLGSSGSDIYLVDCYYQAIMRFDLNCNFLSWVHMPITTSGVSLVNAPFAVYRP